MIKLKNNKIKILVIEDEKNISDSIKAYLEKENYECLVANDGEKGLNYFRIFNPDLVVLDLSLPKISGEKICEEIRKTSRTPIIMLTATVREDDKIQGLNVGAYDYMTKPFSPRELIARIKSLLRRSGTSNKPLYNIMSWNNGKFEIDYDSNVVKINNQIIHLTPSEFKILSLLTQNPNKVFTRDNIISLGFNDNYDGYDRTIDSHIKNLRSKIESDPSNPKYIITVRGVGYRFSGK